MAGFSSININISEIQYTNNLDSFNNVFINTTYGEYMNTLDSFNNISIDESSTVFLTDYIPVDIQYAGISDLTVDTTIRNDTMNTQIKGITDLSIDTAIRNDVMNTQIKGITDLSISPLPYWNPIVRNSQNYEK